MKEDLKDIILMGIGALTMTGEKASKLKKELLDKGTEAYNKGAIKNEELKREIKDKIKENTNIQCVNVTNENLVDVINSLDNEEKQEIIEMLNNKKQENSTNSENNAEENKEVHKITIE